MKFKVGDRVRIHTLDWFSTLAVHIPADMLPYLGMEATIIEIPIPELGNVRLNIGPEKSLWNEIAFEVLSRKQTYAENI